MKNFGKMLLIALFFYCNNSFSQVSIAYTPDSSVMSIIFTGKKINKMHKTFMFDLTGKWNYSKCDSVEVTIQGAVIDSINPNTVKKNLVLNCSLFGVIFNCPIKSNFYIVKKRIALKNVKLNTKLSISSLLFTKNKDIEILIDTYDIRCISN